jgi:hypothetical protein
LEYQKLIDEVALFEIHVSLFSIYSASIWFVLLILAKAQGASADEAIQLLTNSKPDCYAFAAPDGPRKKLFNQELQALSVLMAQKVQIKPSILIRYLGYTSDGGYMLTGPPLNIKKEDLLAVTRKVWPFFSALLDCPGAGAALEAYSLNSANPIDNRIAGVVVLRYINPDRFHAVCQNEQLNNEISRQSAPYHDYFKAVVTGKIPLWGVLPIEYNVRPIVK